VASRWFFQSYQCLLSLTQHFNAFTIHSSIIPVVTPFIFSYLSLAIFSNHDTKVQHFSSSSSSFQHQKKQIFYQQWGSRWQSKHDIRHYNYHYDDDSESDDQTLRRPSRDAMGERPSIAYSTSELGMTVSATHLTPMSARPLNPQHQEVYMVPVEEDECEPTMLASNKVSN